MKRKDKFMINSDVAEIEVFNENNDVISFIPVLYEEQNYFIGTVRSNGMHLCSIATMPSLLTFAIVLLSTRHFLFRKISISVSLKQICSISAVITPTTYRSSDGS